MFEDRQLIGFEDIIGFQYECLRCHAKTILQVIDAQRYPDKCPNCYEVWFIEEEDARKLFSFIVVLRHTQELAKTLEKRTNLKITLEVKSQEPDGAER